MSRASLCLACIPALLGMSMAARSAAPAAVDLAHCAAIAAPGARLACYDALAGRAPDRTSTADAAAPAAPVAPTAATSAATARPATPAAPAPATNDTQNFGLSAYQLHPTPAGPPALQAHIEKLIGDVGSGRPTVVLEGGQTWVLTELLDDPRLGPGDLVTIKRGALGSYVMMTPSKHTYHVRRTQ
jgi:hypothetical protein